MNHAFGFSLASAIQTSFSSNFGHRLFSLSLMWAIVVPSFSGVAALADIEKRMDSNMTKAEKTLDSKSLDDSYIWLEDVTGDKALSWVKEKNDASTKTLETYPEFSKIKKKLVTILDSKEKIPYLTKYGKYYYNFWRDDKNKRGLWRRTTLEEYKKTNPAWEIVIDLDKLAEQERENWTWSGASVLYPDYDRCLVQLSRGGADAVVVREFDLTKKEFVKDGFYLPEAKTDVAWRDRNTLYVGTDFGPGSMTSSGYPRIVKEWKRGTPISSARTLFEGKESDVGVSGYVDHDHGRKYEYISRGMTFFSNELSIRCGERWVKLDKPDDAIASTYCDNLLLKLRSDWKVGEKSYKSGSLLSCNFDAYMKGDRQMQVLFEPTETKSLAYFSSTKNYLILNELDMVRSRPCLLSLADGTWTRKPLIVPDFGTVKVDGIDPDESDNYFMTVTDFLTPSTLYLGTAGNDNREALKSQPQFFKTDGLEIKQFQAVSKDGTHVPYFQVARRDLQLNGDNPTLLNGYGGFEIALQPYYDALTGAGWLEQGGVYVLANIRGGGEFGPTWHNAARKENRQRAYDDFIAIAEDLIARKVTSPKHLGIEGRSNGGLLMGVMLTQRPDLFGAVHCGSPLLDMRRFSHLLAGASWMDEYGDPDKPEQWAFISKYSPYQNLRKDKSYPPILITTSTRDDRVHPGHARKMVARLSEQGHENLYYENIEGGHGAAANNEQIAFMDALAFTFLWERLKR
ncbi:MAG TPA: prolyl oligopeptidase family serine peptidase [Oculatellaceae cyanobacterium]